VQLAPRRQRDRDGLENHENERNFDSSISQFSRRTGALPQTQGAMARGARRTLNFAVRHGGPSASQHLVVEVEWDDVLKVIHGFAKNLDREHSTETAVMLEALAAHLIPMRRCIH
jgi:hypothetical protein